MAAIATRRSRACWRRLRAVAIEGIHSNVAFLIGTLEHPAFAAGDMHTGFVEAHGAALVDRLRRKAREET